VGLLPVFIRRLVGLLCVFIPAYGKISTLDVLIVIAQQRRSIQVAFSFYLLSEQRYY
jgi:hypothetical protein